MKRTWGNWELNGKTLELCHVASQYAVPLDEFTTTAKTLDWIFQVTKKTWASNEDMANLLRAIDELLDPQATLCSGGHEHDAILDVRRMIEHNLVVRKMAEGVFAKKGF